MKKILFLLLTIGCLFSKPAFSEKLTIVAAHLPPHMTEDGQGREADIIRETLSACGHEVEFRVQPYMRHWMSYQEEERYDAVATVPLVQNLPGARSVAYIQYQDGVSYLDNMSLNILKITDLNGKKVIAYQGATQNIPSLKHHTSNFKTYREEVNQINQSRLLFAKRVDAVISDGLIFAAFNQQLQANSKKQKLRFDPFQQVHFQAIFDPVPLTLFFRKTELRDQFDKCFKQLDSQGQIHAINERNIAPYRETVGHQYLQ